MPRINLFRVCNNSCDKAKKRTEEFKKLKQELHEINFKANHELTDLEGGIKQVDTERVFKRKGGKQSLFDLIVNRLLKMCSLRPIVG